MPPRFIKLHGFGNDYIVIEREELRDTADLGEFTKKICDHHYGAGGDGIALVAKLEDDSADFNVRIFNPDGSEASLSGNGTRCAAAYLYYQKLWSHPTLRLSTRAGIKHYTLLEDDQNGRYVFDSELGQPKFDSASIPMITDQPREKVIDYPVEIDGASYAVTALQMGNPNCCIFVSDFDSLDWRRIGRLLENHKQFPERTNVIFVRVVDRKTIELRIWERGVGETMASGTCSCAAAVASMARGLTERSISVQMPGGEAKIQWGDDDKVVLTGTAEVIYSGNWLTTTG